MEDCRTIADERGLALQATYYGAPEGPLPVGAVNHFGLNNGQTSS